MQVSTVARKHHYLPQMFLRRWAVRTRPQEPARVVIYRRGSITPEHPTPKEIAWERGLYRVDPNSVHNRDPEAIENALSVIESRAKGAFDYVDTHGCLDSVKHVHAMADFVSLFMLRTLKAQRALQHRAFQRADTWTEEFIEELGGVEIVRRLAARKSSVPEDATDETVRDYVKGIVRRTAGSPELRVHRIFGTGSKVAEYLRRMNWCIAEAEFPAQFITCDSPVLLPATEPEKEWWSPPRIGVRQKGAEIWFPVEPSKALVATFEPVPMRRVLPRGVVDLLNEEAARSCFEFIVAHRLRPKMAEFMEGLAPNIV